MPQIHGLILTFHGVGEDTGHAHGSLPGHRFIQIIHGRLAKTWPPLLELSICSCTLKTPKEKQICAEKSIKLKAGRLETEA